MITGLCECSAGVVSYLQLATPNLVASTPCLACWAAQTLRSTFIPSAPTITEDPAEAPNTMAAVDVTSSPHIGSKGHRKSSSIGEIDKQSKKRTYRFAHPPPINKQKQILKLRPRVLLQLHQVSDSLRVSPVLDVLPSSIFPSRLPFKFTKVFRGKAGLGPQDLVIIGSDLHDRQITLNGDDQLSSTDVSWYENKIVATVCHTKSSNGADIVFSNGQSWRAIPLSKGSYEFRSINGDGTTTKARWVLRKKLHQRNGSNNELQRKGESEKRFNFSLINPSKRRHAVIASMTRECISVNERYQAVVDPAPQEMNEESSESGASSPTVESFPGDEFESSPQKWIETDETLRTLITASAIWVLFKEGWSSNFSYEDGVGLNGSKNGHEDVRPSSENGNPQPAKNARRATSFTKRPTTLQRNSTSRLSDSKLRRARSEGHIIALDESSPTRDGIPVEADNRDLEANGKVPEPVKSGGTRRCKERWRRFRGAFALVR